MLGPRLATLHNIYFFMWLVRQMRAAIAAGNYPAWKTGFLREYLTERKII
jgi:tRNA-guanine family transglycosylase